MKRSLPFALSSLVVAAPLIAQTGVTDPVLRHMWALGQDSSLLSLGSRDALLQPQMPPSVRRVCRCPRRRLPEPLPV